MTRVNIMQTGQNTVTLAMNGKGETELKRSTETRRSQAEINADSQRHYGGLAELPTDKKASENFHRPAYQAGKLIETQGQQLWHGDVTEYIARKYKIGDDANGEETGREQCKKRERQEENLSQGIQKTWEENQEDRIRD
jgi:hypothetical protein